jgi:signal transduction histidine kinase
MDDAPGGLRPARQEAAALLSLHRLVTKVHAVQDLNEVLNAIAEGVVETLGFAVAAIDRIDPFGYMEAVAVAGSEDARRALLKRRTPAKAFFDEMEASEHWGLLRFMPHDRLPSDAAYSYVPDIQPSDEPDAWHPLDALYVPLPGPTGGLIGVLSVDEPADGRRPDLLSRQMLELFAVQAGLAIHHAQERERLREGVHLAEVRRQVMVATAHEVEVDRILDTIHEPLRVGLRADVVQARMIDASMPAVTALPSAGEALPLTRAERDARVRLCWERREVWLISSLADRPTDEAEAELHERMLLSLRMQGAGSALIVPVGAGTETLACITLLRTDPWTAWTAAEIETMSEIGAEVGRSMLRARLHQQEQRLVNELQELDAYKGEMISTLTHELKNALMAIQGHVSLLRDVGAPARSVDAISRNAGRLEKLTSDLLLLARVRDPQRGFRPELLDFSRLVCSAVELHRDERDELRVSVDDVDTDVVVDGEGKDLEVLVHNLVGNAIKYTPRGSVSVSLRDEGEEVVLAVTDTGIGISPDDFGSLFNEFDRSSNPEAMAVPGSGLGLAIVRRIVERHGGRISVRSALGEGSTFEVRLPRTSVASAGVAVRGSGSVSQS